MRGATVHYDDLRFPSVEDVEADHDELIALFGGDSGVIDHGRLEAAVTAPRQTAGGAPVYPTIAEVAAAYCYGIAMGHAFADGNKRTAITVAAGFLGANGAPVALSSAVWGPIVEAVAAGRMSRETLRLVFLLRVGLRNRRIVVD